MLIARTCRHRIIIAYKNLMIYLNHQHRGNDINLNVTYPHLKKAAVTI